MTGSRHAGGSDLIDWDVARSTARRLTRPGPPVRPGQAAEVVDTLRALAAEADGHVHEFTGLDVPAPGPPVTVVDRASWTERNIDGFSAVLGPLLDRMRARRGAAAGPGALSAGIGSRVTGMELGALLAYLGGKVLGQFEIFAATAGSDTAGSDTAGGDGLLMLVAPNIVAVERELGVDPHDFRLWVCVHEQTHRAQFAAVPWLGGHVTEQVQEFLTGADVDAATLVHRLRSSAAGVLDAARRGRKVSVIDLVQTPEQRLVLDRLTAVMSLLEGHADFVMDGIGPAVIPSVRRIRDAFDARRASPGGLDGLLRRLLGIDAKLRQYRDGERFVRAVVDRVGMAGFNEVWSGPQALPSLDELHDPSAWVARVHGPAARNGGPDPGRA